MIKFNSSVKTNNFESFISEAEKELEKLDIFISPSSFVRQNTPQKREESFVLKITTTAINNAKISFSGLDDFVNQAKKISNTTTKIIEILKGIMNPPSREDFLAEGSQLLEKILGNQAEYQTDLKRDPGLVDAIQSNVDILSDSIALNSKLSRPIKEKIQGFRQGVRESIVVTAAHIEKGKFDDVDKVIEDIQAGENEKRKIELLLNGYKKLQKC